MTNFVALRFQGEVWEQSAHDGNWTDGVRFPEGLLEKGRGLERTRRGIWRCQRGGASGQDLRHRQGSVCPGSEVARTTRSGQGQLRGGA
ncbi:hypothetical protein NN561_014829 [Cricetulus griseus]